jgi:hypothetical protein
VRAAITSGNTVNTPEGRFNAGARAGENDGKIFFDAPQALSAARAFCNDENRNKLMAAFITARDSGDVEDLLAFGRLYAYTGAALQAAVTEGAINSRNALNFIAYRNLLVEAYLSGASVEEMKESTRVQRPDETEKDAQDLRGYMGDHSDKTVGNVAAEIETHFQLPAILSKKEFSKGYLILAAKALLVPVKADLQQLTGKEAIDDAEGLNEKTIGLVLKAG